MHSLSLFLTLLVALTAAQQNSCSGAHNDPGRHCTILTYTDRTTAFPNPPLQSECSDTCRGVLTDAGDWIVDFRGKPEGYVNSMLGYPCGFSTTRGEGEPLDYSFFMHNDDIVVILDEVGKRFASSHGGRVAAEGTMECDGHKAGWIAD